VATAWHRVSPQLPRHREARGAVAVDGPEKVHGAAADGPDGPDREPDGLNCAAVGNKVQLFWGMAEVAAGADSIDFERFPAADINRFLIEVTRGVSHHAFLPKLSVLVAAIADYIRTNGPIPALEWNTNFDQERCDDLNASRMFLKVADNQFLQLHFAHTNATTDGKREYVYDVNHGGTSIVVKTREETIAHARNSGSLYREKPKPDDTFFAGGKRRKSRGSRRSRKSRGSRRSRRSSRR
jgi:hypothetical protein